MATEYKNILLKDNNGNVLLPITLSYYVEYKDGVSVKSYLDSLGSDVDYTKSYIDIINEQIAENGQVTQNIINSVNDILTSYVQKPDHMNEIGFDNTTYAGLSDDLKNLTADTTIEGETIVTAQKVIEVLDSRISYNQSNIEGLDSRLTEAESYIEGLKTTVTSIDERLTTVEGDVVSYGGDIAELKEKVNIFYDENNNLNLNAYSVKYTGSASAGTAGQTNVQNAIDTIGAKVEQINTEIEGVISQAGVTYVKGVNGILVNDLNDTLQQGALTVKLNTGNDGKIKVENGVVTVDESKLDLTGITTYASDISGQIQPNQIAGGLDADNINITYSYTDASDVTHNDGEMSVQEFYNTTYNSLTEINETLNNLDTNYAITVTDDGGENNSYARVYTIQQGNGTAYTINIPKDQFLKTVEYAYAQDGTTPALVFHWNLPNADADDVDTSYVPITDFIDAITGEIASDITVLEGKVTALETSVSNIEASYITGATINGNAVTVTDHILQLSYNILYDEGSSSEPISASFLTANGITL